MTEISNDNAYVAVDGSGPRKPLQDDYHWITPDTGTTGVLTTSPVGGKIETVGYDCSDQAKSVRIL